MRNIIFRDLLSLVLVSLLTSCGATPANAITEPLSVYSYLDEWGDVCYDGGNYIYFEGGTEGTGHYLEGNENNFGGSYYEVQHWYVDHAEIKYVPTDHDVDRGAATQQEQWDARDECQENEKDVAYGLRYTYEDNYKNSAAYEFNNHNHFKSPWRLANEKINDFIKDIRWSSSNWNIRDFDNGVFDDPAEIFEGRYLDDLPNWLEP